MKAHYFILFALLSIPVAGIASDTDMAYARASYKGSNGTEILYRVLSPDTTAGAPATQRYPLVVFMHGSGERGDNNSSQLDNGAKMFIDHTNRQAFPSYVIFPQCPDEYFWSYSHEPHGQQDMRAESQETPVMSALMELIDSYRARPDIDPDRIYVVGLSMGGMAVYDMVIRHPDTFAAAVSICGAVDPDRLPIMRNVPLRIFHGAKDKIVPVQASEAIYTTLKKLGADVEYIEFPNEGHDSWDSAFAYPDFLPWIYAHHRPSSQLSASIQ